MTKPMFGFTYPTVTGETKTQAWRRVHADFPNLQVWSDYYEGTKLPTWTGPWFTEAGPGVIFLISVKHPDVRAVGACVADMPDHLRGRVILFLHHEPDQYTEEDPKGDPAPMVWIRRQIDFADLRESAHWCDWIEHWVCFTEDRMRRHPAVWENNWGGTLTAEPRIDGVAADCFNIGRSIVRTGEDMYRKPLEFARRVGRRLIIRENGQVTPIDSPVDSPQVVDAIREHWAYAKSQNEIDDVFRAIVWYNNHRNTYFDPSGKLPGRPDTKAALVEIMADAATPDEDPDPCCVELEAMTARVAELLAEVAEIPSRLQEVRLEGRAEGRAEAFAEVTSCIEEARTA